MITDVVFRSLRSRSRLISVEELINACDGSRMPEVVPTFLTVPIALKLADVCPTHAIAAESGNTGTLAFRLDYGECIGCGRCVDAGEGAIRLARTLSRCGVPRKALVRTWHIGSQVAEDELVTPEAALDEFHALLGRALNIRQLDPGSCNGCEAEITALANPYYDLERFGIHFVASPKHADMLLVTGPITRNMATAVRRTYEAVPAPKLVVAVGVCGCSAGVFDSSTQRSCSIGTLSASNEEIVGPVDSLLPVDGYIPGCPPTPAMLVSGILRVLRRSRK